MKRTALVVASALLLTGCGGSARSSSPTVRQWVPSATTAAAVRATTSTQIAMTKQGKRDTVRAAVRAALAANHKLAIRVLWTNRIPITARKSTRGPALAELAATARDREKKGVRVRMMRDDYRIISIGVDATRAHATAFAQWDQQVVPSHLDGTPLGRAVSLRERARVELRRSGSSQSFVVWKVTLVK